MSDQVRARPGDGVVVAAIGRAAREHVVRGFSKELRIDRLESLYASILASKNGR